MDDEIELAKKAIDEKYEQEIEEGLEVLTGHVLKGTIDEGKAKFRECLKTATQMRRLALQELGAKE